METEMDDFEYSPRKKIRRISETGEDEGGSNSKSEGLKSKKKGSMKEKNFAKKYMIKHGFTEGKGLGKHQDGIVEPVEASKQKGTRGLGFKSVDLEDSASKFDPSIEWASPDEEFSFLINHYEKSVDRKCLESWMEFGSQQKIIDENSYFCSADIIRGILNAKNSLGKLSSNEVKNGRRANPFESIHNAIFLNRAAMKMANLDAILDKMFTEPKKPNGEPALKSNELLYFADVCAGPGGFSEYVLFRKKWRARGFGFTLKIENDFQLEQFQAGPPDTFEPYYGAKDDGDVYLPENQTSFRDHVLKHTDGKGVHFMMADGGFHIDENLNDQELICKKLYLCQCLVALQIVRTEGHFVVKLFDLFTKFSVGLLYLMYRSFREIAVIKPNTSRPANSERYLVCKWKREDSSDIASFLFDINKRVPLYEEKNKEDVLELVPIDVLLGDKEFYDYIKTSNEILGRRQTNSLYKFVAYCENSSLKEERQQELRQICLKKWNVPDEARADSKKCDSCSQLTRLVENNSLNNAKNYIESLQEFRKAVLVPRSWYAVVVSLDEAKTSCGLYLGLGRNNIKKYVSKKWVKVECGTLCLPAKTLVYGEILFEYSGSGSGQIKTYALHIIDGIFLGGEDIKDLTYCKRREVCELFAKALHKENSPVRVKAHYPMMEMDSMWAKLNLSNLKSQPQPCLCMSLDSHRFYRAGGIIFIRDTKGPWERHISKKQGAYIYNRKTKDSSVLEIYANKSPMKYFGDFEYCFKERLVWQWSDGVVVHEGQSFEPDSSKLQRSDVEAHIKEATHL